MLKWNIEVLNFEWMSAFDKACDFVIYMRVAINVTSETWTHNPPLRRRMLYPVELPWQQQD